MGCLPTCQLANLPTFRLVGLLAGSGDGGEVVLRGFGGGSAASECWCVLAGGLVSVPGRLFLYIWRVGCFLVFWESNLAIRHCGNFKFSYSDFPHSWIEGVNLRPVDNPLKTEMTTPAKWDTNSRNPG